MTPASDTTRKALSRRIKQHVIGRPQDFYTITLPGLETLCRSELAALEDPPADLRVSKGGVAFQGRLTSCYQANLMCRTASRVLMRIQQCKARHFDELEERVRAVPWELYLKTDASFEVRASIRRSKLYHSQAVSERILKAVSARLVLHGRKDADTGREGPVQCIWARLQEDRGKQTGSRKSKSWNRDAGGREVMNHAAPQGGRDGADQRRVEVCRMARAMVWLA